MTVVETIQEERETDRRVGDAGAAHSIVVATDGSHTADPAFRLAELLERKNGCRVYVLSVLEPLVPYVPMSDMLMFSPQADTLRTDAMRDVIERQTRRFDPKGKWNTELRIGSPAATIARFAREHQAALVIVGANKHGLWDRVLGEDTAMEIARFIDVPLCVASHDLYRLPKRVLVAMDIKPFGFESLPPVLEAIADTNRLSCVHVKPRVEFPGIDWAGFEREYDFAMQERFARFESMIGMVGVRAELIVAHGDVTREIADAAAYGKHDLLIVGINRSPGKLRAAGGRFASRMLRHAAMSVLIVPSRQPGTGSVTRKGGVTEVLQDPDSWSVPMKGFTARNAGRICTLEIDDPELGALVEASRYPLLGVDYDHKDGRLTISIGDSAGVERHLTRSIPDPESISILSVDGRDSALSVVHGVGQTLLTFSS